MRARPAAERRLLRIVLLEQQRRAVPGRAVDADNAVGQPLPAGPGVPGYLSQPVASAPENQYNYFDLTGAYTILPTLRTNFSSRTRRASRTRTSRAPA